MKIASFKHSWLLALALLIIPAQSFATVPTPMSTTKRKVLYVVGGIVAVGLVGLVSVAVIKTIINNIDTTR
jgi:hypothetical protein